MSDNEAKYYAVSGQGTDWDWSYSRVYGVFEDKAQAQKAADWLSKREEHLTFTVDELKSYPSFRQFKKDWFK